MSKKLYKFNIDEKLNDLSYKERNEALKLIPDQLAISKNTFYEWRRIKKDSKQDVPAIKLAALAKFFKCQTEELINYKLPVISTNAVINSRSHVKKKFKMSAV